jgi:hypothetical protein
MDVKALQWELAAFVAERGLESRHSPKSLAMALAGEAGTLLDLYKWLSEEESRQVDRKERERTAAAIAEIFVHALRLADELGIDVEDAVAGKMARISGRASARAPEPPRPPPTPPAAAAATPVQRTSPRPTPQHAEAVRPRPAAPPSAPPPRPAASAPPRPASPAPAPRPAHTERPAPPPEPPPPPPEVERYADLDLDTVSDLLRTLSKRIDDAQSHDPLARELHDELGTLRRTLYGKTLKRAWVGASLKNIRTMLGAALHEQIGDDIRAKDYIAQIDYLLKD